jgi:hypothetical protein
LSVLGSLAFGQFGSEHLHGFGLVLMLAPLVLTGHHDPRRKVGQPDSRIGLVDMLTARTGGTVGVDTEVLLIDLHLVGDILEERDLVE